MNVPGRKNIVTTAMAFIAEESRLLSLAMSLLCSDMRALNLLPVVMFRASNCRLSMLFAHIGVLALGTDTGVVQLRVISCPPHPNQVKVQSINQIPNLIRMIFLAVLNWAVCSSVAQASLRS